MTSNGHMQRAGSCTEQCACQKIKTWTDCEPAASLLEEPQQS